jgi:hypothetical protein
VLNRLDARTRQPAATEDVYQQIEAGLAVRRSRLEVPYREHLQCRAAFYFQRVTLPTPHEFVAQLAPPPQQAQNAKLEVITVGCLASRVAAFTSGAPSASFHVFENATTSL